MKARIFKEESLATFDGEGIRYALFFSGCPLRCVYCHNPESWDQDYGYFIDSEEMVKKLLRYKPYFKDKGGVTFSGGEPLLQSEFILEMTESLKNHQINTALDTSLSVFNKKVKEVLEIIDTPIVDIKFYTQNEYLKNTNADNVNLISCLKYLHLLAKPCIFRTVIIPGINDTINDIEGYISFVKPFKRIIKKYELLPFHTLGFDKYEKHNLLNPLNDTLPLTASKLNELQTFANSKLNLGS